MGGKGSKDAESFDKFLPKEPAPGQLWPGISALHRPAKLSPFADRWIVCQRRLDGFEVFYECVLPTSDGPPATPGILAFSERLRLRPPPEGKEDSKIPRGVAHLVPSAPELILSRYIKPSKKSDRKTDDRFDLIWVDYSTWNVRTLITNAHYIDPSNGRRGDFVYFAHTNKPRFLRSSAFAVDRRDVSTTHPTPADHPHAQGRLVPHVPYLRHIPTRIGSGSERGPGRESSTQRVAQNPLFTSLAAAIALHCELPSPLVDIVVAYARDEPSAHLWVVRMAMDTDTKSGKKREVVEGAVHDGAGLFDPFACQLLCKLPTGVLQSLACEDLHTEYLSPLGSPLTHLVSLNVVRAGAKPESKGDTSPRSGPPAPAPAPTSTPSMAPAKKTDKEQEAPSDIKHFSLWDLREAREHRIPFCWSPNKDSEGKRLAVKVSDIYTDLIWFSYDCTLLYYISCHDTLDRRDGAVMELITIELATMKELSHAPWSTEVPLPSRFSSGRGMMGPTTSATFGATSAIPAGRRNSNPGLLAPAPLATPSLLLSAPAGEETKGPALGPGPPPLDRDETKRAPEDAPGVAAPPAWAPSPHDVDSRVHDLALGALELLGRAPSSKGVSMVVVRERIPASVNRAPVHFLVQITGTPHVVYVNLESGQAHAVENKLEVQIDRLATWFVPGRHPTRLAPRDFDRLRDQLVVT